MKNKENKDWIDRLLELGYTKDIILSILINNERVKGNLINLIEILSIKEDGGSN
ncbi:MULTISPECIES: hypothetical protein [Sphingobacterium]|uniref:hypothetical protein n=1 Tax=Sphingobacterium TaxID=28453 RepID=UPI0013DAD891|nr:MULTISPECIES: hypothetical protein [unclassified Sphingobacterium]